MVFIGIEKKLKGYIGSP